MYSYCMLILDSIKKKPLSMEYYGVKAALRFVACAKLIRHARALRALDPRLTHCVTRAPLRIIIMWECEMKPLNIHIAVVRRLYAYSD